MKVNRKSTVVVSVMGTFILITLAYAVIPNVYSKVSTARVRETADDISMYGEAVYRYMLDHNNTYPRSLNELYGGDRNYVRELEKDSWGNPYNYQPPASAEKADYKVWSSGPDGVSGTDDDVTSSSELTK